MAKTIYRASLNVRDVDSIAVQTIANTDNVATRLRIALEVLYLVEQRYNCSQNEALNALMKDYMTNASDAKPAEKKLDVGSLINSLK